MAIQSESCDCFYCKGSQGSHGPRMDIMSDTITEDFLRTTETLLGIEYELIDADYRPMYPWQDDDET